MLYITIYHFIYITMTILYTAVYMMYISIPSKTSLERHLHCAAGALRLADHTYHVTHPPFHSLISSFFMCFLDFSSCFLHFSSFSFMFHAILDQI